MNIMIPKTVYDNLPIVAGGVAIVSILIVPDCWVKYFCIITLYVYAIGVYMARLAAMKRKLDEKI